MLQDLLDVQGFVWEGKPILSGANEENRRLDESLKQKKMEVQRMKSLLENENTRGKAMHTHYSDLRQEINYIREVQNARRHEMEIEDGNQRLLASERSRLMQEIDSIKKEISSLGSRKKIHESTISEQKEKAEALKTAIQWEEEALLKWLQESADIERDKIALMKYTHQDDSKIKELSLSLEKLSKEAREKKKALDDTDTEVFIAQSELDRVQEEFRKAHVERQDIVSNWEEVLNKLQQRNEEIESLSKYMAAMREEEKFLNQQLGEQQQLLSSEQANNKELSRKLAENENYSSKLRIQINEEAKQEADLRAEMQTLRNVSTYLAYQVQHTQINIQQMEDELKKRNDKLQNMENAQKELQQEIEDLMRKTFDAEQYAKELNKILEREDGRLTIAQREFLSMQNAVLRSSQNLKETLLKEKVTETHVKGAEVQSCNLSNAISKLDSERLQQQTMMYRINLCIEQTEHRIRVMEGELANEEERLQMEKEKSRLQGILDKKKTALAFLDQQVKTMREKINVAVKTLHLSKKQNSELSEKNDYLEFYITNSLKSLKTVGERKENLLVDDCLVKLQLSHYKDLLRQKNESVLDLQRNQVEFEAVMKERILELKSCKDLLQAEVHKEEEECYQTRRQLQEYCDKVTKLQTRYEVVMNALGLGAAGDSPHSNLLIKAEDEKRALKQEKDEMLSKVIQSEDDLHALRNTLMLIQMSIQQFRQALNPSQLTSEETEKLRILNEECHDLNMEMQSNRQQLQDIDENIFTVEKSLTLLDQKIQDMTYSGLEKRKENEVLKQEITELETKLLRADKSNSQIAVNISKHMDVPDFQEDMKVHLLRELRKIAIEKLFTAIAGYPEAIEQAKAMFQEAKLPLPLLIRSNLASRISLALSGTSLATSRRSFSGSRSLGSSGKNLLDTSIVSLGFSVTDSSKSSSKSQSLASRISTS